MEETPASAVMAKYLTWYLSLQAKRPKEKSIVPWPPRPPWSIKNQAPNYSSGILISQKIRAHDLYGSGGKRNALIQKFSLSTHSLAHFGYTTENADFSPSSYWVCGLRKVPQFLRTSVSPLIRYQ